MKDEKQTYRVEITLGRPSKIDDKDVIDKVYIPSNEAVYLTSDGQLWITKLLDGYGLMRYALKWDNKYSARQIKMMKKAINILSKGTSDENNDFIIKFNDLTEKWLEETAILSSITAIVNHPSYQEIISMGPKVLPMIFKKLDEEDDQPNSWFHALETLTGEDPITEDMSGKIYEIAQAWLAWGRKHKFL